MSGQGQGLGAGEDDMEEEMNLLFGKPKGEQILTRGGRRTTVTNVRGGYGYERVLETDGGEGEKKSGEAKDEVDKKGNTTQSPHEQTQPKTSMTGGVTTHVSASLPTAPAPELDGYPGHLSRLNWLVEPITVEPMPDDNRPPNARDKSIDGYSHHQQQEDGDNLTTREGNRGSNGARITILCVCEKPSIALTLAKSLASSHSSGSSSSSTPQHPEKDGGDRPDPSSTSNFQTDNSSATPIHTFGGTFKGRPAFYKVRL